MLWSEAGCSSGNSTSLAFLCSTWTLTVVVPYNFGWLVCLLVCLFVQCVPASGGSMWIGLSVGQTVESVCGLGTDEWRDEKRPTNL